MNNIGIVSGYFNPLHGGHIDYIHASKLKCEYLIVIINNDYQVKLKKSIPFMDENHRKYIIDNLRDVDNSIISIDMDKSVCKSLEYIRAKYPQYNLSFFNSGDRTQNNLNKTETEICFKNNIKEVVIDLPKRYNSSELLKNLT